MTLLSQHPSELHRSGESAESLAPMGSLTCVECGYAVATVALDDVDDVPRCPNCGGSRFRHASLFEHPTMDDGAIEPAKRPPSWLDELRVPRAARPAARLPARRPAHGRRAAPSLDPDRPKRELRRRHRRPQRLAPPCADRRTPLGELRALDDRSLNGLFVNGERGRVVAARRRGRARDRALPAVRGRRRLAGGALEPAAQRLDARALAPLPRRAPPSAPPPSARISISRSFSPPVVTRVSLSAVSSRIAAPTCGPATAGALRLGLGDVAGRQGERLSLRVAPAAQGLHDQAARRSRPGRPIRP